MAQPADGGGKNPLGIVAFWPPNQAEPQLLWEQWKQRFHWAMVAKHGIVSSEYYFASTLTEAQITDLGDIGGKPRAEGERTLISNLYLCLGHEGQRALHNQHPHLDMETKRYPRFLDICVALFQKERNETYEMYQMLSRKQKEGESLESFYAELSGMAARCNLGTQERKMVRDIFIFNMRNRDAQNELCRETKTPEEALRIAMSYERGDKYARSYKGAVSGSTGMAHPSPGGSLQIKTEPVSNIRGSRGRGMPRGRGQYPNRGGGRTQDRVQERRCYNCDQPNFTPEHRQRCPARAVTCNFCKKIGHFERTCRGKRQSRGGQPVGLIQGDEFLDEEDTPSDDVEPQAAASSVGFVKREHHSWSSESSDDYMVMAIRRKKETMLKVAGPKLKVFINGHPMNIWIDSGSPISILTLEDLRRTVGRAGINLKQGNTDDDEFRDYSNNRIKMLGRMELELASNGWKTTAEVRVIGGTRPSIVGRDLMGKLGLQLMQADPRGDVMNIQGAEDISCKEGHDEPEEEQMDQWQSYFSKLFPKLFTRVGKIRNYKVQAEFFKNLVPVQQKGRRVPVTLQEKVDKEIDKLLTQGHIEKLKECSDRYFVSPIVITVKKDGSVKLALESRELNKQVHKNKYQMPNIEELVDTIGQLISEKKQGEVYFTTMDLTYAYGQLPLSEETSVHCNFSLVGGRSTGTYRFRTGFYGLTSMPAEFQRVMDSILNEFPQANAFIDDILVTTKGTEVEHISLVEKILRKLNHENISLKLPKCEFAKRECEWLGHRITETGVTPLKRKTSPIDALKAPKTVTQLKSFMGSIHSLHKYLPAIAEMSAPLRPLLSKKNEYNWTAECENAFQNIKVGVANIVELKHFDIHKDIRVVCDASHNGLGAVLEQLGTEGWSPISFASRFLNAAEKKYSTNELEMLAVVWGAEYFRNYILGRSFTVITDHKALISLLNGNNKKNKTLFSRLTRWLDRLIPFDFVIEHKPGAKIGLADYLSRHPSEPPKPISQYDNLFTVAKIASIRKSLGFSKELKPLGKRNYQNTEETGSKQSKRFSSNHKRERITCIQPATVEGGKSCVKTATNRKRSICILRKSKKSKGHSVCSIYCSLGRR